ncbi:hypothetical protein ACIBM4_34755 [Streptomyces sp. NPDC050256]|uniref:hypothetical protein n=1 Tax=Streptomyces sp. NPDC050256 TaxID=3365607 RepID=UPI00379F50DA
MTSVDLMDLSEEDALILWRHGGYGSRDTFPGARVATLHMIRGFNRSGRKALARLFASLAPHAEIRAVLALLRTLANLPAPIALPAPAPVRLTPQGRFHRFTPARAP